MLGTRSRETTPVSRPLLRDLAVDLGTQWRELGKILGLANSLLNYFDMENLSLSDKGNAMLGEWKRLNGDDGSLTRSPDENRYGSFDGKSCRYIPKMLEN